MIYYVLGYFMIGFLTACGLVYLTKRKSPLVAGGILTGWTIDEPGEFLLCIFIWPIVFVAAFFVFLVQKFGWVKNGIYSLIKKLMDWL